MSFWSEDRSAVRRLLVATREDALELLGVPWHDDPQMICTSIVPLGYTDEGAYMVDAVYETVEPDEPQIVEAAA